MMDLFYLFIPAVTVISGFLMHKFPPKKANVFMGYRTRLSMLSVDTWQFANRYCGKLWIVLGFVMLGVSGIVIILFAITKTEPNDTIKLIIETGEIGVLLGSIIPVEMKLKRNFDENGNRR